MKCRPPVLVLLGFPAAPPGPALRAPLLRGDFCAWTRPRAPPLPGLLASFVFLSSSSSSPGASEAPAPSPGTAPPSSSTRSQVLPRSLTELNSASAGGFPGSRIWHRPHLLCPPRGLRSSPLALVTSDLLRTKRNSRPSSSFHRCPHLGKWQGHPWRFSGSYTCPRRPLPP